MCILIHQPKGFTFSNAQLRDFHDYNPDGFGFMYHDRKARELVHFKTLADSADAVIDTYRRYVAGRECVLHFRMATHGTKTPANAHPFEVVPGVMLAHNGVLAIGNPVHKHRTDTEHFIEFVLRPYALQHGTAALFDPKYLEMVGDMIGPSNKFALVSAEGHTALVNEDTGVRHKGVWLSNTYAWSAPSSLKGTGTGYTRRGLGWDGWDGDTPAEWEDAAPETGGAAGDEEWEPLAEQAAYWALGRGGCPILTDEPIQRLAEYVRRHPLLAVRILAGAYGYGDAGTLADVADYAEREPETIAGELLDVLEDFEYLTRDADAA